jgi:hypothetical protein
MSDRKLAGLRIAQAEAKRLLESREFRRVKLERQLVPRQEAAKLLAVTLRTLRRWHEENRGPSVVFFRRQRFYALPDIREYLAVKEQRRSKRSPKNDKRLTRPFRRRCPKDDAYQNEGSCRLSGHFDVPHLR